MMAKRPKAESRHNAVVGAPARATKPTRRIRTNLSDFAYERLEELIVTCALRPGAFLSIQDLQEVIGVGRTPIHHAVNRLAADTLIIVRPRHGLQLTPIDLARERILLQLRRDMERFVVRLATERANASHRNQLLHIIRSLRENADRITVEEFNRLDRRVDQLFVAAAGEPFIENTLRPLHTISRRIGWIYHSRVCPDEGLGRTLDCHLAILDAVAARKVKEAVAASDRLIAFCDSMFDVLGRGINPALFDCNMEISAAS